jgi:hypothetical protein
MPSLPAHDPREFVVIYMICGGYSMAFYSATARGVIGVQHGIAFCASRHTCHCSQRFTFSRQYSVPSFRRVLNTVPTRLTGDAACCLHCVLVHLSLCFVCASYGVYSLWLVNFCVFSILCASLWLVIFCVFSILCASIGYLFRTCVLGAENGSASRTNCCSL